MNYKIKKNTISSQSITNLLYKYLEHSAKEERTVRRPRESPWWYRCSHLRSHLKNKYSLPITGLPISRIITWYCNKVKVILKFSQWLHMFFPRKQCEEGLEETSQLSQQGWWIFYTNTNFSISLLWGLVFTAKYQMRVMPIFSWDMKFLVLLLQADFLL